LNYAWPVNNVDAIYTANTFHIVSWQLVEQFFKGVDASGDPVAIATGSDGQVLTSTGAGSPPAFEAAAGGGAVSNGTFTRSLSTATGTQAITGVGFEPDVIFIHGITSALTAATWGVHSSSAQRSMWTRDPSLAHSWGHFDTSIAYCLVSGGNIKGVMASIDADGFTITWTRSSSPAGTHYMNYICWKA